MDKESIKQTLKRLPIWGDAEKLKCELDQLAHDVRQTCDKIDDLSEKFDSSEAKQYIDEDIVRLYHQDKSKNIIVEEPPRASSLINCEEEQQQAELSVKPKQGELVYVMEETGEPWVQCRIVSVLHKPVNNRPDTIIKVKSVENSRIFSVGKFEVARVQDHGESLRVPKRIIAGVNSKQMLPGTIGQEPCDSNKHRYMVFLDEGKCQYFEPKQVYPVLYQSRYPWRDLRELGVRNKHYEEELSYFFSTYPRRSLLRARVGDPISLPKRGQKEPLSARITHIDCDTMQIIYEDDSKESMYMGCPRLNKCSSLVSQLTKDISVEKLFPRLVGNMERYHDAGSTAIGDEFLKFFENFDRTLTVCGTNVARKSTSKRVAEPKIKVTHGDSYLIDDRDTKPFLHDIQEPGRTHKCSPECLGPEKDVEDMTNTFREVSELKVPLRLGWKRLLVKVKTRSKVQFIYQAPCGRICKNMAEVKRYIVYTGSKLDVDCFTFDKEIQLNRNVGDRNAFYYVPNFAVEPSTKRPLENKFISVINPISEEQLPCDFEYCDKSFPHPMLKSKGFSFNENFKSGCDCKDDCSSRSSCACHRLIEDAAGSSAYNKGTVDDKCHYKYKRLLQQVSTGIFECNDECSCSSKCPNRVVQNGIRVRLQVRKTIDKGWGVFTLDDIPAGAFICTYSAEILDDADQYGDCDTFYADMDFITIVERQKQQLNQGPDSDEGVEVSDGSDDSDHDNSDHDSRSDIDIEEISPPDPYMCQDFMRRNPRRNAMPAKQGAGRRTPQFKKIHKLLGCSQDYTLDARQKGNIGRFFNHSCDAPMYPQNVFISTHDPRLPNIAFFTKRPLKADDELTWHYNYKIGSVPGRRIDCKCGAPNCQGRLL